jgi:hypothetical protein
VRKLAVALVVLVVLAALGYAARGYLAEVAARAQEQATGQRAATMADLGSIDQLKAAFDSAAGEPRLVLLLSPT